MITALIIIYVIGFLGMYIIALVLPGAGDDETANAIVSFLIGLFWPMIVILCIVGSILSSRRFKGKK